MRACTFGLALLATLLSSASAVLAQQQPGGTRRLTVVPAPVGPAGKVEELYTESRALLIGVSRYDQSTAWPTLDSVPSELNDLKAALHTLGFNGVEQLCYGCTSSAGQGRDARGRWFRQAPFHRKQP